MSGHALSNFFLVVCTFLHTGYFPASSRKPSSFVIKTSWSMAALHNGIAQQNKNLMFYYVLLSTILTEIKHEDEWGSSRY